MFSFLLFLVLSFHLQPLDVNGGGPTGSNGTITTLTNTASHLHTQDVNGGGPTGGPTPQDTNGGGPTGGPGPGN